MSLLQSNLRKQIRKLPKILKLVKIIQYYSISFNRVLNAEVFHSRPHRGKKSEQYNESFRYRAALFASSSKHLHYLLMYFQQSDSIQPTNSLHNLKTGTMKFHLRQTKTVVVIHFTTRPSACCRRLQKAVVDSLCCRSSSLQKM